MKRSDRFWLMTMLAVMLITATSPTLAQEPETETGFTADFLADLNRVGGRLAQLAEAVPADKYSWRPNEEVRTVSEVYMHVAGVNMLLPMALGAPPPEGLELNADPMTMMREMEAAITTQADVVSKLRESFEYAAEAIPKVTDLDTVVETFGFPASKRAYLLILLTHAHEHLGQSIAYARSLKVVPPWSQQQAAEGGEGGGG